MARHARIIHSTSTDPWFNLALEEYLVNSVSDPAAAGEETIILFLWQNDNTVVIGRNQNAWGECRTALLEDEGGKLARRSTGGGAVFHDLGNLNFSVITPKDIYDIRRSLGMIVDAVNRTGVHALLSGRNDILADDRKFSGNAFLVHKGAGLHHGTLLIHSDYERIARYLNVNRGKLESKGIRSVQSRVVNLAALMPSVTVDRMKELVELAFIDEYRPDTTERDYDVSSLSEEGFGAIHDKYRSWEWRYGESIRFTQMSERYFEWGNLQMGFVVRNGLIEEAKIYTDALDSDFFTNLSARLAGIKFTSKDIAEAVRGSSETGALQAISGYDIKEDLCGFIGSLEL
ncbi:MAG: lipoate--protein ligase [Saccharofermentanales bacterium]